MPDKKPANNEVRFTAFKNGDEREFSFLFRQYYAPLCYFANRYMNDKALVEDVVQESFIKLWEKRGAIHSSKHIKAYLYKVVYYACIDRKRLLIKEARLPATGRKIQEPFLHAMIRTETLDRVYKAINNMPPAIAKVMNMIYADGKTVAETAKELQKSIPTIKSQKARGLQLIKEKLPDILTIFLCFYDVLKSLY